MNTLAKIALCLAGTGLAIYLWRVTEPPELHCSLLPELADRKLVPAKLKALAWPPDPQDSEDSPRQWLAARREHFYPELLEALDAKPIEVAQTVLTILDDGPATVELADALVRIASDKRHRLWTKATFALRRFAGDPRVRPLLASALQDTVRYPDPLERAEIAEALHDGEKVVALLVPVLESPSRHIVVSAIRRLGRTGQAAAIAPLASLTRRTDWRIVAEAKLALHALDPRGHPLTEGQKVLLDRTGRIHKGSWRAWQALLGELTAWPESELRPLVMQMLGTDAASEAAGMVGVWKVREALPELDRLLWTLSGWPVQEVVGAYLAIDDSEHAADEIVRRAARFHDQFDCFALTEAVATAAVPLERRLALLHRIRERVEGSWPDVIPRSLRKVQPDPAALFKPLFESENDISALGFFAELVEQDPRPEYGKGLQRALSLVARTSPDDLRGTAGRAATAVLKASARLPLQGLPSAVAPLLDTPDPVVRIAANCELARRADQGDQRTAALEFLASELGGLNRPHAAECLAALPCRTPEECARCEQAVLALLGQPAEDRALRVLARCGGQASARALLPLLDGPDVGRAIHAAWVLAQLPDAVAARKAKRRLALHGFFHHQVFQQSQGVVFEVAPDLYFDQTARPSRPGSFSGEELPPVVLSEDLYPPRQLDPAEQEFLLRDYRAILANDPTFGVLTRAAVRYGWLPKLDLTWTRFLEVVSREDNCLQARVGEDGPIAFFPNRKLAAEAMARLTGKPASYVAFGGEIRDSDSAPAEPYRRQNRLIARFVLDLVQAAGFLGRPRTDPQWRRRGSFDDLTTRYLKDGFGPELKQELLDEARRRDMAPALKEASFALWTERK